MKKTIAFIRSLLFSIVALLVSIPLSVIFMIYWVIPDGRNRFDKAASHWGAFIIFILRWIVGVKSVFKGLEKINKNKAYILIGKHESTWDTLVMHMILKPAPVFILKKELLKVPFFGWCLAIASKIAIDRRGGAASIRKILSEGKEYVKNGHSIIIFPQGTRVPYDSTVDEYPYKGGFIALIKEMGVDILPMALNSGKIWKKGQFLKYSGTITMEILDPIKYEDIKDMDKQELLKKLENIIETKSKELNKLN